MKEIPAAIGDRVLSRCGRDEGRIFLVIGEIDADFVWIADGKTHRMDRPKKKRRRHLKCAGAPDEALRERILRGEFPKDHEIRSSLST